MSLEPRPEPVNRRGQIDLAELRQLARQGVRPVEYPPAEGFLTTPNGHVLLEDTPPAEAIVRVLELPTWTTPTEGASAFTPVWVGIAHIWTTISTGSPIWSDTSPGETPVWTTPVNGSPCWTPDDPGGIPTPAWNSTPAFPTGTPVWSASPNALGYRSAYLELPDAETDTYADQELVWAVGPNDEALDAQRYGALLLGPYTDGVAVWAVFPIGSSGAVDSVEGTDPIQANGVSGSPLTGAVVVSVLDASASQSGVVNLNDQFLGAGAKWVALLGANLGGPWSSIEEGITSVYTGLTTTGVGPTEPPTDFVAAMGIGTGGAIAAAEALNLLARRAASALGGTNTDMAVSLSIEAGYGNDGYAPLCLLLSARGAFADGGADHGDTLNNFHFGVTRQAAGVTTKHIGTDGTTYAGDTIFGGLVTGIGSGPSAIDGGAF